MILFTISVFLKALIALSVMSNKFGPSAILLDLENREISQLKANQNMYRFLDMSSPYGCMHGNETMLLEMNHQVRAFKFLFSGWSTLLFIEVGISESNTKGCSGSILFSFEIPGHAFAFQKLFIELKRFLAR